MGYDVHITRAECWTDSEEHPISLDEWLAYVEQDPEMRHDGFAEAQIKGTGRLLRIERKGIAVWMAYSRHLEGGNMAWFSHRFGAITVKNPDHEMLDKMCRIARFFGARVQGDEREIYEESSTRQGRG
jgi:hypothetical protein